MMTTNPAMIADIATALLPCPFCGASDPLVTDHPPHKHAIAALPDHPGSVTVECPSCDIGLIKPTRGEAIAAWNRRAAPAAPSAAHASAPAAPGVAGDWKPISEAPQAGMINVRSTTTGTYRWRAYRPGSPQLRRGIKGRWQRATDYGWENAELPENGEWKPVEITRGVALRSAGEVE